jgi:hypothetical protein
MGFKRETHHVLLTASTAADACNRVCICNTFPIFFCLLQVYIWNTIVRNTECLCMSLLRHKAEHYARGLQMLGHSIVSQHFVEPESTLPYSQELSTCPYLEPDQSSPHHPIPPLQDSSHLHLGLPSGLLLSGFLTSNLYASSSQPFVLHALPISSSNWLF